MQTTNYCVHACVFLCVCECIVVKFKCEWHSIIVGKGIKNDWTAKSPCVGRFFFVCFELLDSSCCLICFHCTFVFVIFAPPRSLLPYSTQSCVVIDKRNLIRNVVTQIEIHVRIDIWRHKKAIWCIIKQLSQKTNMMNCWKLAVNRLFAGFFIWQFMHVFRNDWCIVVRIKAHLICLLSAIFGQFTIGALFIVLGQCHLKLWIWCVYRCEFQIIIVSSIN